MTQYLLYICTAFLASAACGFVMIPQIMNYCKQNNLYDIPNSRKVHQNAVPRLGGISFLPSMLLAFFLVTLVMSPYTTSSEGTVTISLWSAYFLISLLLIYSVGIVDDLIGLNAKIKFIVQIVAAAIIPMSGLYINTLYGLWGIYEIPFELGAPLTVFIMVFIMNAINLIDGIDGLAASLSFLALGGFLMSFLREGMFVYCILIAGLMGVLLPYSYFNIFGKVERNRKIFMGDSGSLTLGFILSFLFVKFAMDNPNVVAFHLDGLLLPYTLLVVPVFDVARVILVRLYHHQPLFDADKNHIHHKLMRAGMSQHQTLLAIIMMALTYIVLNFWLFTFCDITAIVGIDILLYIATHQVINWQIRKWREVSIKR